MRRDYFGRKGFFVQASQKPKFVERFTETDIGACAANGGNARCADLADRAAKGEKAPPNSWDENAKRRVRVNTITNNDKFKSEPKF